MLSKVLGILLVMPFLMQISNGLNALLSGHSIAVKIAAFHVLFNVLLALILLPLLGPFMSFVKKNNTDCERKREKIWSEIFR